MAALTILLLVGAVCAASVARYLHVSPYTPAGRYISRQRNLQLRARRWALIYLTAGTALILAVWGVLRLIAETLR